MFFFGGSTSLGVGPHCATVASYQQEELNDSGSTDWKVAVYNFGRSGYHSTQEQILLHRLVSLGFVPDSVIFLDGLNDFCFRDGQPSSWTMLDRYFNEVNAAQQDKNAGRGINTDWNQLRHFVTGMPLLKLIGAWTDKSIDEAIPAHTGPSKAIIEPVPPVEELETVIDRYISNIQQVEAVGDRFGFSSFFIWQPIPTYRFDANYHLFYTNQLGCHTVSKYGYPLMAKRVAAGIDVSNFLWAADMQQNRTDNLYINAFHYTAPFSRDLVEMITDILNSKTAYPGHLVG